jgi:hypothetical protein
MASWFRIVQAFLQNFTRNYRLFLACYMTCSSIFPDLITLICGEEYKRCTIPPLRSNHPLGVRATEVTFR